MADIEMVLVATFFELIIGWLQLRQQNSQETLFQTHPKTMSVAVSSLLICWFLYGCKLRFRMFSTAYRAVVSLGVDFFGSLSMASALSFLFPDFLRPLVYFLGLVIPGDNIVYWILQKMEVKFGQTAFWIRYVDPVLIKLIRMRNGGRLMPPILPS